MDWTIISTNRKRRRENMATQSSVAEPSDRVLIISRIFDAPRELVFKAWTDPKHLVHWMGPRGFKSTVVHSELREGGAYRIHMRGPEGDDHWTQGVFREILPPRRLVMAGSWADAQGNATSPETLLTLTFEEHEGKTRLTLHQSIFESVTARDEHRGGWSSSLDRLGEYLATL
jgi:uncharacterized protein YndB with AHSA1/START domain